MRKFILVFVVVAVTASMGLAEMDRSLYTKENAFPEVMSPEVSVLFEYREIKDRDEQFRDTDANLTTYNFEGRFRPIEEVALRATVPFSHYDPSSGDSHRGMGDISFGADLIAFQNIFDYPYVIPYVDYTFETGDEDKHLGVGEDFATIGLALGTTTFDKFLWSLDVSYNIYDNIENAFVVGVGLIWEISDEFSTIAETKLEEQSNDNPDNDDYAIYFTGGMIYDATDSLTLGLYGTGTAQNAEEDVIVSIKASYEF